MDCSPPGSPSAGVVQEWVAIPFSRGSSQPRNQTQVSCIVGAFFTDWASGEAQVPIKYLLNERPKSTLDTQTWGGFCCSVAQSCPTPRPHGLQHTGCLLPTIIFKKEKKKKKSPASPQAWGEGPSPSDLGNDARVSPPREEAGTCSRRGRGGRKGPARPCSPRSSSPSKPDPHAGTPPLTAPAGGP